MIMKPKIEDYQRHLEEQLLNVDDETNNVPEEEAGQALVTSTNSNTYPSNCYSEYQISLMDPSLQTGMEVQRTTKDIENNAYLLPLEEYGLSINDDVMPEATQLATIAPSTISNTWPSNYYSEHQITLNSDPPNTISCTTLPAMDQNQIPHSTAQNHTYLSTHPSSDLPMHQPLPTNQFNSQIPYSFQVHNQSPNPVNELSPQVPSSVPVQMSLPMNQFNLQNTTQVIPNMPTGLVHQQSDHMSPAMTMPPQFPSSDPFHAHSTPQNQIVYSVPPIHQDNTQNLSNGDQYNPQPHHELSPLTSPDQYSSNIWLSTRQHLVNQPSFNLEAPINVHTNINKGKSWTEEEHRLFLIGMERYGKGQWKKISINVVKTKTPTQIASHAQKFFDHQINKQNKKRRRKSIHDIINPYVFSEPQHQNNMVAPQNNEFVPSSSLPMHQLYNPQNPPNVDQSFQFVNSNSIFYE